MATRTKGDVIIEDIKVGDIHHEIEYGCTLIVEVVTMPVRDEEGYWSWKSKSVNTGEIIEYGQREGFAHYGLNLYNTR